MSSKQRTFTIVETATYRIEIDAEDCEGLDEDELRELAEERFCGLADPNEAFIEVSEREVSEDDTDNMAALVNSRGEVIA